MISAKNSESIAKNTNDPSPNEFAKYLPWACSKYGSVEHNVYVTIEHAKADTTSVRSLHKSRSKINKSLLQAVHSEEIEIDIQSGKIVNDFLNFPVLNKEPVNITATYDRFNKLIKVEFEKQKHVPLPILRLFLCVAEYHPQLHYLIMSCKINQQTIHIMSKYLPCNITHLNLDDTFIPEANYHTLLGDGTQLKELSLARCKINDSAVSLIADKLAYPNGAARVLTALNLSSNNISDFGAFDIATGLRSNRKLIYLNLAGNKLTDNGATEILNTLIAFPLTVLENSQRMKDHVPYMLNKLEFYKEVRKQIDYEKEKEKRRSMRRSVRRLTTMSPEQKHIAEKKRHSDKKIIESVDPDEKDMEENPMRPFRSNDLYVVDDTWWSYGNNILCYLNFAYNDLTCFIIKKILEILKRQKEYKREPTGLIRVRLEGNQMPFNCREMKEVQAIFEAQFERFIMKPKHKKYSEMTKNYY